MHLRRDEPLFSARGGRLNHYLTLCRDTKAREIFYWPWRVTRARRRVTCYLSCVQTRTLSRDTNARACSSLRDKHRSRDAAFLANNIASATSRSLLTFGQSPNETKKKNTRNNQKGKNMTISWVKWYTSRQVVWKNIIKIKKLFFSAELSCIFYI